MKINRFKLNEKVEEKYYIFTELIEDDFFGKQFVSPKLYDNKVDAMNFILNKLYNAYKENKYNLEDLEESLKNEIDIDEALGIYENFLKDELDKPMNLSYRMVALNEPKLEEWIAMRRNLKKFNI